MRRTVIAVTLALAALGCSDSVVTPVGPPVPRGDVIAPTEGQIKDQIVKLVPGPGLLNAANAQFDNVVRSWTAVPQRTNVARQQQAALCKFIKKLAESGKLLDPNGADAPTIADAVSTLCAALNMYVGLSPTGTDVSGGNAVAVFVPNVLGAGVDYTYVFTPNHTAGIRIPAGAFGQDVVLTITPFQQGATPLNAPAARQIPYFFEYQTSPVIPEFAKKVTVAVCTDENLLHVDATVRLAHNVGAGLEVLAPGDVSWFNTTANPTGCPPVEVSGYALAPRHGPNGFLSEKMFAAAEALDRLGVRAVGLVSPTAAYAYNIIAGGDAGSFSPFGGVNAPNAYGSGNDAAGDATPYSAPSTSFPSASPDLVAASDSVTAMQHHFQISLAAGTLNQNFSLLTVSVDADSLPSTGHPGVDAGGVNDASIMGTDYIINVGAENGSSARIFQYAGTPNSFTFIGSVPATFTANAVSFVVPESMLGYKTYVNFKVTAATAVSTPTLPNPNPSWGYTGVLDYLTNVGQPAIKVRAPAPVIF